MAEITLMQTGERLTRLGHVLNRIRRLLRGAGLLEESESIRVAARECWRAGRLIERKPAAVDAFRDYLNKHPEDFQRGLDWMQSAFQSMSKSQGPPPKPPWEP